MYHDRGWLTQRYTVDGLTHGGIAEIAGCGERTIAKWINRYGIKPPGSNTYRNAKWLRAQIDVGRTIPEIAEEVGLSEAGVYYWTRKHDIPLWEPTICTCEDCGKEFRIPPSAVARNRRFCSFKCYNDWRRRTMKPEPNCVCEHCGTAFYVKPAHVKKGEGHFCSKECYNNARRGETCVCEVCGKEFYVERKQFERGNGKYCSYECKWEAQKTGCHETCPVCGQEYYVTPSEASRGSGKYCSISCAMGADNVRRWQEGVYDGVFRSPTSIELETAEALLELEIKHEREWRPDGYSRIYDFLVPPHVLIEVQGDYWHSLPERREADAEKAKWAEANGYKLVELWEHEIHEYGALELVSERVMPLI